MDNRKKRIGKQVVRLICNYIGIAVFLTGSVVFTMSMLLFFNYFIDNVFYEELIYAAGGSFVLASIGYIVFLLTDR